MTPSCFWRAKISSRSASQPAVEAAGVLVRPLLGHVVRGVRRAGREVGEERLVGHQRLLLAHPVDRLVGHVAHEVVALLGRAPRLDRGRPLIERRVVLVRLAADEAVEVLEAAARGPVLERPQRAGLPHRDLVALAELGGRVAVQLEDLRERSAVVRPLGAVARSRGGDLGDAAHADHVMVAPAQERRPRRRAQRRRVEAVVLQPAGGEPLRVRRRDRAAERAGPGEAHVVEQDDQHVRRAGRRTQRLDRSERRVRVLRVIRRQRRVAAVGCRQDLASGVTVPSHLVLLWRGGPSIRSASLRRPGCVPVGRGGALSPRGQGLTIVTRYSAVAFIVPSDASLTSASIAR